MNADTIANILILLLYSYFARVPMFKLKPYWVDPERFGPSLRAPLLLLSQVSILNDAMAIN
jgi:hypothetical protein